MNTGKNDVIGILNKVKEQAIKEFAEKLKNIALPIRLGEKYYDVVTKEGIEHLVKEMTGGENNG